MGKRKLKREIKYLQKRVDKLIMLGSELPCIQEMVQKKAKAQREEPKLEKQKRVTRNGISIYGKNYFAPELFYFCGQVVNVVTDEENIFVSEFNGTPITTFRK